MEYILPKHYRRHAKVEVANVLGLKVDNIDGVKAKLLPMPPFTPLNYVVRYSEAQRDNSRRMAIMMRIAVASWDLASVKLCTCCNAMMPTC